MNDLLPTKFSSHSFSLITSWQNQKVPCSCNCNSESRSLQFFITNKVCRKTYVINSIANLILSPDYMWSKCGSADHAFLFINLFFLIYIYNTSFNMLNSCFFNVSQEFCCYLYGVSLRIFTVYFKMSPVHSLFWQKK